MSSPDASRPLSRAVPRSLPASLVALLATACATSQPARAPVQATPFQPPAELRWFRTAAERDLSYVQAYRQASAVVARVAPARSGPWAVVLDADETVLDNSEYQDRVARSGKGFQQATWDAWAREKRAVAFRPARDFIRMVRAAGGKVAIVTNRDEPVCEATRETLSAQGVEVDAVLCAPPGVSEKQSRFDRVASGAAFGLPGPVEVVLFVGDNVQDCPGQTQARFDPALFGERCIVLPNPMYGSWTSNPYR